MIPWRRAWQPTLVFLPGECHGQKILVDYTVHGAAKELAMTEVTQQAGTGVYLLLEVENGVFCFRFCFNLKCYWRIIALQCCIVSAVQNSESAVHTHVSLCFVFLSRLEDPRALSSIPCAVR